MEKKLELAKNNEIQNLEQCLLIEAHDSMEEKESVQLVPPTDFFIIEETTNLIVNIPNGALTTRLSLMTGTISQVQVTFTLGTVITTGEWEPLKNYIKIYVDKTDFLNAYPQEVKVEIFWTVDEEMSL